MASVPTGRKRLALQDLLTWATAPDRDHHLLLEERPTKFPCRGLAGRPRDGRLWLELFPFLASRQEVNRVTLRADLFGGLTAALVVLPQGVTFAVIAGLRPDYGLYTAMIPTIEDEAARELRYAVAPL